MKKEKQKAIKTVEYPLTKEEKKKLDCGGKIPSIFFSKENSLTKREAFLLGIVEVLIIAIFVQALFLCFK